MTFGARIDWRSKIGAALVAAVAAFFVSQVVIAAHTAKYGDGPHEHGGQVCVLSMVAPQTDKAVGAAAVVLLMVMTVWRAADQITQTERALLVIRAARPRGPPTL